MSDHESRPPLWIGHVALQTDRMEQSAQFMRTIGMRPVHQGPQVAVFELRGGTHVILIAKREVVPQDAPFDLMVEDLRATHQHFTSLGLAPTPIEALLRDRARAFPCPGASRSPDHFLLQSLLEESRVNVATQHCAAPIEDWPSTG